MKKEYISYDLRADIYKGIIEQTILRRELHDLMISNPNSPRVIEVRGLMMENRLGKAGLRSLNNQLRGKSINKKRV